MWLNFNYYKLSLSIMKRHIFTLTLIFLGFILHAQEELEESPLTALALKFNYGVQIPAGDLADRFGSNFVLGLGAEYINRKSIFFGAEFDLHFGSNVKEDALASLRSEEGDIIGNDRSISAVFLRMRAISGGVYVGKIFSFGKLKNTGLKVSFGAGFIEHRIRFQDDNNTAIQLFGDYSKGYDRLANGFSLRQFIGYQYMSDDQRINIYGGFDFTEAFTKGRRDWNYDQFGPDKSSRTDILVGFRVGLILPFFFGADPSTIYY